MARLPLIHLGAFLARALYTPIYTGDSPASVLLRLGGGPLRLLCANAAKPTAVTPTPHQLSGEMCVPNAAAVTAIITTRRAMLSTECVATLT